MARDHITLGADAHRELRVPGAPPLAPRATIKSYSAVPINLTQPYRKVDLLIRIVVRCWSMSDVTLTRSDAVAWLQSLKSESVDLVVTDPPYESLEKHRAIGTTTRLKVSKGSSNQWFSIFPNDRFPEFFAEIYRVLKPNTHFYLFSDPETAFIVKPMAEKAGFRFWKPLIWDKKSIGMGYHYRCQYEFVLFFEKGKRRLRDLSIADVIPIARIRNGYPSEKPVDLAEILIRQSALPDQLVADPFMGSGSFGVAAVRAGCHFAGNDIAEASLACAREKLEPSSSRIAAHQSPSENKQGQASLPLSLTNALA
jgi:site-specific DNA-methyltransferase (adenine-specific)